LLYRVIQICCTIACLNALYHGRCLKSVLYFAALNHKRGS
jgi:hypothetical protein